MQSQTIRNNPVLVVETRSGIVENTHTGVVCCVKYTTAGEWVVLNSAGDVEQLFYPRSCLKFVQVLPLLESGAAEHYGFSDDEIAVMCSSHSSEPCHLATVRSILLKAGIDESELRCGGHTPVCAEAAFDYVRNGATTPFVDHIYNNCSGKHAGFLALCKFLNEPLEGYLDVGHRIQQLVMKVVCDVFELDPSNLHIGVDGCSAPNYAMNARQAAIGYARLGDPEFFFAQNATRRAAVARMITCVTQHSYMVYGEKGYCSELMKHMNGAVIGKRGAGGVYMCGLVGRGVGCAVKIDSGKMGPQYCVIQSFLEWYNTKYGACYCRVPSTLSNSEISVIEEPCDECTKYLQRLNIFKEVPDNNAMGHHVGSMMCIDDLYELEK